MSSGKTNKTMINSIKEDEEVFRFSSAKDDEQEFVFSTFWQDVVIVGGCFLMLIALGIGVVLLTNLLIR